MGCMSICIGGARFVAGRECLDHVIVLNEDHLRRVLRSYFDYWETVLRALM